MRGHFFKENSAESHARFAIFSLMNQFEEMYEVIDALLSFSVTEENAKDLIENHLLQMTKLNQILSTSIKQIEEGHTFEKQKEFEKTPLYEAARRTFNFLTGLNHLDLDRHGWLAIATRCVPDKIYYRQIKALVY